MRRLYTGIVVAIAIIAILIYMAKCDEYAGLYNHSEIKASYLK